MTQEQKDLLLLDLCARLPYGVKCKYYDYCEGDYDEGTICGFERQEYIQIDGVCIYIEEVKPYLFPLSSMTEEQKNDLIKNLKSNISVKNEEISFWNLYTANRMDQWKWVFDWCDKNHFDYRGLIPMGLAIDATNLNIY